MTRSGEARTSEAIRRLVADPPDLPVRQGLGAIVEALDQRGTVVVQAPPGTGKTTLVPLAVAGRVRGTVVVTQPRRIAARAAARRLAGLLGERVGDTVGYAVRGDRQVGAATRIEVVTTGVLLRRLQRDPELPGVSVVILDEVHERHLDADLALALLVDVRDNLRPDLGLVAMSATVEAERTAALLSAPSAPVVSVTGSTHPVDVLWCPPRAARSDARGLTPAFFDHVGSVIRRACSEREGDVLVFVPGVREIDAVVRRLGGLDADVLALHGRLPGPDQDRALAPGPRRRVVVATAVAESSLTVPGVRLVVDAGLSREPRTDLRRGMAGLVTVSVSRANAEQRAGRAGREGPGAVYRCWAQEEHPRLAAHPTPEMLTADLTGFALEVAAWGNPQGHGLTFLDDPPLSAMDAARSVLAGLGAVDEGGHITTRGREIARVPVDPRLGRALIDSAPALGSARAAEIVALLADDTRTDGADLVATWRRVRSTRGDLRDQARRLERVTGLVPPRAGPRMPDDLAVGLVVALAHPERIARRRADGVTYLMVGGTGAALPPGSPLRGHDWLAVADVDRTPGSRDGLIRAAAPIDEDLATEAAGAFWHEEASVTWEGGRVVARRRTVLGAITLTSVPMADPAPHDVVAAIRAGLAADGLDALPWREGARALRARLDFLHRALGAPWPDVSDAGLLAGLDTWLGPDLARVRTAAALQRLDVLVALRRLLPWPAAARLDDLAPERLEVPSGSRLAVDYSAEQPVLAVRVQEAFGWKATPLLADGRVPVLLHLLSPAGRPAAVTADLASFWRSGYAQVRADLRGRYPKHAWPEDPTSAEPTRTTRPRILKP